jgi:hypothetical protein
LFFTIKHKKQKSQNFFLPEFLPFFCHTSGKNWQKTAKNGKNDTYKKRALKR